MNVVKNAMSRVRTSTSPLAVPRSMRPHDMRAITSLPAGKMVPIKVIPLLREDAVASSRMRLTFEMYETAEILMNAVRVEVSAYLVPNLAFARFKGMDSLNRAYEGIPEVEGDDPIPYFVTMVEPAWAVNKVHHHLGIHAKEGDEINSAYVEAYNTIWNFKARNRSQDIAERLVTDYSLAPAFWQHSNFDNIVPDFDQAVIDGEVALNSLAVRMPVKGLAVDSTANWTSGGLNVKESGGTADIQYATAMSVKGDTAGRKLYVKQDGTTGFPDVFAELEASGITVSLSNIELAKKTAAFAKLRQAYAGHNDDYIIDLLMDGISIPEQDFRQPILLGKQQTVFGMSKRYSTSADDMTKSVVNGLTQLEMSIRTPRVPTGGVIMLVAEITPEQLWERTSDPYLYSTDVDTLPQYLRDELDPEKVEAVPNKYVDVLHANPNDTFGYAPLNYKWHVKNPTVGGTFFRKVDDSFDEDRQRIWAAETVNPVLSEDFYLCTDLNQTVFEFAEQDNFEVVIQGGAVITGNTVFGAPLVEASNDYELIKGEAETDRIVKD